MLTSPKNPLLKSVRRAISRGTPTEDGFAVAEGLHLLEEAVRSRCEFRVVLVDESARNAAASWESRLPVEYLAHAVFLEISTTENSQGVISLVRVPEWTLDSVLPSDALAVVLDGIQEPGNAGAIVRAAEAFGATGVVFLKGTVSPFNPKSLRAAAGSLFRIPFVHSLDADAFVSAARKRGLALFAAMASNAAAVHDVDLRRPGAIVMGSEGHGVCAALASVATPIRVPTRGVESLNAAVAAGVLLYEAQRQRMTS